MPAEKLPGERVFAGTMNQSGVLEIRTDGIGHDTAFGRIIELVERAERSRAPIEKIADRLAGYLVYFALACAALTFWITCDARSTISVIVVAGACGIASRNTARHTRRHRSRCAEGRDHQGRPVSGRPE